MYGLVTQTIVITLVNNMQIICICK